MDFFAELKKLFENFPEQIAQAPEITKEIEDAYKAYGFDPANPPSDHHLAMWTMDLIYKWHTTPNPKMNLPLTGLCLAYNMTTWGKLNQLDQMNLKTLLSAVYNMGYNMGAYKLRSPFDEKPKPQDLN